MFNILLVGAEASQKAFMPSWAVYVAKTGLAPPSRFPAVWECLSKFRHLVKKLELTLGSDTGELMLRVGMHSGPVTVDVLRGEKARFQLFGNTMNTAARNEHNGVDDRIQVSEQTAHCLNTAGKSGWLTARAGKINAKGKRTLQTYSVEYSTRFFDAQTSSEQSLGYSSVSEAEKAPEIDEEIKAEVAKIGSTRYTRSIDWNTETLVRLLGQIVARRRKSRRRRTERPRRSRKFVRSSLCPNLTLLLPKSVLGASARLKWMLLS